VYSNFINLQSFFDGCKEEYCILKIPTCFPNYVSYSDLDILCINRDQIIEYTLNFLSGCRDVGVTVSYPESGMHAHVDVYRGPYTPGKSLDFKFDFIDSFSLYKKNIVSECFAKLVLDNRVLVNGVFVPSVPYEMVIRMLEYLEYFDKRPDKIKHLKWVESQFLYPSHTKVFREMWDSYIVETEK